MRRGTPFLGTGIRSALSQHVPQAARCYCLHLNENIEGKKMKFILLKYHGRESEYSG